jgi:hypothetical protein
MLWAFFSHGDLNLFLRILNGQLTNVKPCRPTDHEREGVLQVSSWRVRSEQRVEDLRERVCGV